MLRFVIRRRELDRGTGLATESLETVDAECQELERVLRGGGLDPHGAYDHREVAGVEVLPDAEPGEGKDDASIVRAGYISAPLCGRKLPPDGYRMTINVPLRNACKSCCRVWQVRHGA